MLGNTAEAEGQEMTRPQVGRGGYGEERQVIGSEEVKLLRPGHGTGCLRSPGFWDPKAWSKGRPRSGRESRESCPPPSGLAPG